MNTSGNMKKHFFSPSNDHGPDFEEPDPRPSLSLALRLWKKQGSIHLVKGEDLDILIFYLGANE
jgi:hypothetical protein